MIVKNEAHCIRRCLESVKMLVDSYCICDTGSTDGTPQIILETMRGIPGLVYHREWEGFGPNRTEAIFLSRHQGVTDLILWIDADEELTGEPSELENPPAFDAYSIPLDLCGEVTHRYCLLSASKTFWWEGTIHEELHCDTPVNGRRLSRMGVKSHGDGGRHRNPNWALDDLSAMQKAVDVAPNSRNLGLLGQMYEKTGRYTEALQVYNQHIALKVVDEEERWYALLRKARTLALMGKPVDVVREAFLDACMTRPTRAEAYADYAAYLDSVGERREARVYRQAARSLPMPSDIMYLRPELYRRD